MLFRSVTSFGMTVSGRKQQVMAATRVVMKVNVAGQTKNFSAVADLEAWDNAGNVLDVNISPTQGQAQYELNLLRKDKAVPISAITVVILLVRPSGITIL